MTSQKTAEKTDHDSFSAWRYYFVILAILAAVGLILHRLYCLQVKAHAFYQDMADDQHRLREKIFPDRGEVFLTEKDSLFPVAVNRKLATVYVVPREIEPADYQRLAAELARILQLDQNDLSAKLSKKDDWYEVIKRKLSPQEEEAVKQLGAKGVYTVEESWRYYPGGSLSSQIVGFVGYNEDRIEGRYGVEKYFEDKLKGSDGILEQERDTGGRWISIGSKSVTPAQNGDDIILTIDHIIQFKAETALKSAVERHQADGGKIIIMEPNSGKVLAMAAEPSFNLNEYSSVEDINVFRNPVISDAYESGSVFKPFTMAAGLDSGVVAPDTTYIDTGQVSEAGFTITNSDGKANGQQTMTNVIEKSLNTGVIHVEKLVGNERFYHYVNNFGFGERTGIQLPFESGGNISNLKTNRNIEFFTASFGQGITVTPLQLAVAYSALANGGDLVRPQVVEYFRNSESELRQEKEVIRRVISKNTANQLALMLESNVLNGHGKLAGVPGYRVAGKTGTAQIPDRENGGYKENATVGSFAGFAPVDNPRFVMLVVIDYPKDVEWAESTAAPVFGELAKFMFDYYGIEPTEDFNAKDLETFTKAHNYLEKPKENEDSENAVPGQSGDGPTELPKKIEKPKEEKKKKDD